MYRGGFWLPGKSWGEILPTYPRLPRAVLVGLADAQAEGDSPGKGGIVAGGSGWCLECSLGEPPASLALAVVPDSLADAEEDLDTVAAEDDAEGGPASRGANVGSRYLFDSVRFRWLGLSSNEAAGA